MSLLVRLICLLLVPGVLYADDADDGFELLFNGNNLSNWVLTNTPPSTWIIQDNMLVCSGRPYGEIRTRRMYQNFVLEVEWRHLVPKGNAGIFLWADDIPSRGVPFHRGIEVQVLEHAYGNTQSYTTHGDIFPIHGARMTPNNGRGGSRAFPTELRGTPSPEWNHYRITCNNGAVSLEVNGAIVTSGHSCSPRKGYLCLESEGGVVHYRNMKIKTLPNTPVAEEDVAIANRGFRSMYTGLNLSGWQSGDRTLQDETAVNGWRVADWTLRHNGPESRLVSTAEAGRTGFLLDVRRTDEKSAARISLSSGDSTLNLTVLTSGGSTPHMNQTPGHWNRIEYDWRSGAVQLKINGKAAGTPQEIDGGTPVTAIQLEGTGRLDFANLFERRTGTP